MAHLAYLDFGPNSAKTDAKAKRHHLGCDRRNAPSLRYRVPNDRVKTTADRLLECSVWSKSLNAIIKAKRSVLAGASQDDGLTCWPFIRALPIMVACKTHLVNWTSVFVSWRCPTGANDPGDPSMWPCLTGSALKSGFCKKPYKGYNRRRLLYLSCWNISGISIMPEATNLSSTDVALRSNPRSSAVSNQVEMAVRTV